MAEKYVNDGDLGSGKPGSLRWHKCNLAQFTTDEEKIAYIRETFPNMTLNDRIEIAVFLIMEKADDGHSN